MNAVDVVVGVVVVVAAVRGYFRGFFRELFGLLALAAAIVVALEWAGAVSAMLADFVPGPDLLRQGLAFVAVFLITNLGVNLIGLVLDRLAAGLLLGGVNRLAGALFGGAKAVAVAAVVLLFVHLFPSLESVDQRIMSSKVGRPLVSAATTVLQFGLPPEQSNKN